MKNNVEHQISFLIFNCIVNVSVRDSYLRNILKQMYGVMETKAADKKADLEYIVEYDSNQDGMIVISRLNCEKMVTDDIGEFVFLFEKDMTIELQKIRSDLLFIHSAALEYKESGLLIVAPSGTGKSTTSWAMLNSGFNYLSDELAPLDLKTMNIDPYPHALCLKAVPPVFDLPNEALHTNYTIHVPGMLCTNSKKPSSVKLKYIFYLEYDKGISDPVITPVSAAEASAKLYTNSLNILAHDVGDNGIKSAISVVKNVKCYSLRSNNLNRTCDAVKRLIDEG